MASSLARTSSTRVSSQAPAIPAPSADRRCAHSSASAMPAAASHDPCAVRPPRRWRRPSPIQVARLARASRAQARPAACGRARADSRRRRRASGAMRSRCQRRGGAVQGSLRFRRRAWPSAPGQQDRQIRGRSRRRRRACRPRRAAASSSNASRPGWSSTLRISRSMALISLVPSDQSARCGCRAHAVPCPTRGFSRGRRARPAPRLARGGPCRVRKARRPA